MVNFQKIHLSLWCRSVQGCTLAQTPRKSGLGLCSPLGVCAPHTHAHPPGGFPHGALGLPLIRAQEQLKEAV